MYTNTKSHQTAVYTEDEALAFMVDKYLYDKKFLQFNTTRCKKTRS